MIYTIVHRRVWPVAVSSLAREGREGGGTYSFVQSDGFCADQVVAAIYRISRLDKHKGEEERRGMNTFRDPAG
jgi:tellurite resistance protein